MAINFYTRREDRTDRGVPSETFDHALARAMAFAKVDGKRRAWDVVDAASGKRLERWQRTTHGIVVRVPEDDEIPEPTHVG